MRDEFTGSVKNILAKRVGQKCSNPTCRAQTSGPQEDPDGIINIGVAAHITAASPGGPRYDSARTPEFRRSAPNGIWLCQSCAKLIDNDESCYTVAKLQNWKSVSEAAAKRALERREMQPVGAIEKVERLMPELLSEMRQKLTNNPLNREFVVLKREWCYNASGPYVAYYYNDHLDLDSKLRILLNLGLIEDITHTNTKRFTITEGFVDYLEGSAEHIPIENGVAKKG